MFSTGIFGATRYRCELAIKLIQFIYITALITLGMTKK